MKKMAELFKKKYVVTSFLLHHFNNFEKVLILKRSKKVSTFRLHWAGVSGRIEKHDKSPLECAFREIQEETKLDKKSLQLKSSGSVLKIKDESNKTLWFVHPFLFSVSELKDFEINWEHENYTWIPTWQVGIATLEYPSFVPYLKETFWRVYIPLEIQSLIDQIKDDRQHGAQELANTSLDAILTSIQFINLPPPYLFQYLSSLSHIIGNSRKSMAPIISNLQSVLSKCKEKGGENLSKSDLFSLLQKIIIEHKSFLKQKTQFILKFFTEILQKTITKKKYPTLTIMMTSYSSTLASLLSLSSLPLNLIITESRPLCEGLKNISQISNTSHQISIITDNNISNFVQKCDMILLGADKILPDGSLINKSGSSLLALASHHLHIPVYAVTTLDKLCNDYEYELEEMDTKELFNHPAYQDISFLPTQSQTSPQFKNIYFDITPPSLISSYITEEGVIIPSDIKKYLVSSIS